MDTKEFKDIIDIEHYLVNEISKIKKKIKDCHDDCQDLDIEESKEALINAYKIKKSVLEELLNKIPKK